MKRSWLTPFSIPTLSNGLLYLVLVLAWTWFFLMVAVLLGDDATLFPTSLLRIVAGLGPLVIALVMMKFRPDGEPFQAYWQRLLNWRSIPRPVLLISILFQPIAAALGILTAGFIAPLPFARQDVIGVLVNPGALLWLMVFTFFFGPLPEELGWRGYGLPRLQSKWRPLSASLLLGLVWNLWHLPLFFLPGTYQFELIFASPRFWLFAINLMSQSILMTALLNASNGATLTAILFHYMTNLTGEVLHLPWRAEAAWSVWTLLAATIVAVIWIVTPRQEENPADPPILDN
jgi:membrane protease YdiL (CAAX protease family)